MSKVIAITTTSLRRFLRTKENLFFVFGFPILIIFFVGIQFGGGLDATLVIVGDSTVADAVAEETEAAGMGVQRVDDRDEAEEWVARGWAQAAAIVPDGDPWAGDTIEIEYLASGAAITELLGPIQAAVASSNLGPMVTSAVVETTGADPDDARAAVEASAETITRTEVDTEVVGDPLFEGDIELFDIGASSQVVLFTFLTSLSTSGYLILTRKLGVARRMLSTPTSVGRIVTGETVGRYAIAVVQALFIVVFTALIFGVDWGDPWGSAAVLAVFSLVATGAGILLGSIMKSDSAAGGIGVMLGIGLGALGGGMVPYELFPETLQQVARFTPHNWALEAFRILLFEDGTIADITTQLAVLAGMGVVVLGVSVWFYRRSIVEA